MAITFKGSISTLSIIGNDATTQNLFTIENQIGSRVNVNIRRLLFQLDGTNALTAFMPLVKTSRCTNINGGATLAEGSFNTNFGASNSKVVLRSAVADQFPITATAADTIWQQFLVRMHTAAEQVLGAEGNALPGLVHDTGKEFKLRPGESLLCRVVAAAGTSNSSLINYWTVGCVWEEDEIGTFAISGFVTLSAVGVAGAKVIVMEADDQLMTNPVFVGVVTTAGDGSWSSAITTGKVGAAFVQYKSGATLYNAPGSPFLQ